MHNLVVGLSGAGKSRLAKSLIVPQWRKRKVPVLVCDPVMASDWGDVQLLTDDPYRLLALAQASQRCVIIVDECDEALRASSQQERDLKYLATRSRNDGHLAYFLAQRAMQVPPSYRNQCSTGYVFNQTREDAEVCYSLFNSPPCRDLAPTLPLGTFLQVAPGRNAVRIRLF